MTSESVIDARLMLMMMVASCSSMTDGGDDEVSEAYGSTSKNYHKKSSSTGRQICDVVEVNGPLARETHASIPTGYAIPVQFGVGEKTLKNEKISIVEARNRTTLNAPSMCKIEGLESRIAAESKTSLDASPTSRVQQDIHRVPITKGEESVDFSIAEPNEPSKNKYPAELLRLVFEAVGSTAAETMTCFDHRKGPWSRRKLSDTILTLRAVYVLNENINTSEIEQGASSLSLREVVGDVGLALFSPLDEGLLLSQKLLVDELLRKDACPSSETSPKQVSLDACPSSETSPKQVSFHASRPPFFEMGLSGEVLPLNCSKDALVSQPVLRKLSESSCSSDADGEDEHFEYIFDHEIYPVQIEAPEDPTELSFAPSILDNETFQQIVDEALPSNLRMYKWKRIFSIAKDGDLLFTMLERCSSFKNTLVVLKTTKGNILGGFASEKWKAQDGYDKRSYFGTGVCFLFSDYPKNPNPRKELSFHRWSGVNDYCQICDPDSGKIAMGGGEGDFGLIIEDSFLRGSSGHCATFNNPSLVPGIDESFDILEFEVYGQLPLIPTVSRAIETKYSELSLLRSH
jgi:hypothetical protein